ncbi:hypothetical protein ACIBBE_24845 [Streptomyces sp. NPDC051644]
MPTAQLEAGTGDLTALLATGRDELLFGARMTVDFAARAAATSEVAR